MSWEFSYQFLVFKFSRFCMFWEKAKQNMSLVPSGTVTRRWVKMCNLGQEKRSEIWPLFANEFLARHQSASFLIPPNYSEWNFLNDENDRVPIETITRESSHFIGALTRLIKRKWHSLENDFYWGSLTVSRLRGTHLGTLSDFVWLLSKKACSLEEQKV